MKQDQFNEIIEKQLEIIKNTLLVKSKEYATVDKLHNFRTSAILQQCTMEQALAGMLSKHTVSIYDMIQSGDRFHIDKWDEKINDHIVYLLLLRAIVQEGIVYDDRSEIERLTHEHNEMLINQERSQRLTDIATAMRTQAGI